MKRSAIACGLAAAITAFAQSSPVAQEISAHLTANALKADVSFLASDALEGRGTPSRGLDVAAEYIAAQFRRAGLEPAGDDEFFQTAHYVSVTPNPDGSNLALENGATSLAANPATILIQQAAGVDLKHAAALKIAPETKPDSWGGKVLFFEIPDYGKLGPEERRKAAAAVRSLRAAAEKEKPALLVLTGAKPARVPEPEAQLREASSVSPVPVIQVFDTNIRAAIAAAKPGPLEMAVSAHLAEPTATPVLLRNVIGILRGSDPALKETYVLVSAHYDHVGVRAFGPGDRIYNGANDDASGTATVIESANALAGLPVKPRRSIAFLTFFGEERGLLGSSYYIAHPVLPLEKTVADINLEQMGRTDDVQGTRLLQMNATGFDYTSMVGVFGKAGEETGIRVVKDAANSDPYFRDSDNFPFAKAGVPSHTFSVAYEFPDYHKPGDEWPKLDYENMARVDRAVALGVWMVADSTAAPVWNIDQKTLR